MCRQDYVFITLKKFLWVKFKNKDSPFLIVLLPKSQTVLWPKLMMHVSFNAISFLSQIQTLTDNHNKFSQNYFFSIEKRQRGWISLTHHSYSLHSQHCSFSIYIQPCFWGFYNFPTLSAWSLCCHLLLDYCWITCTESAITLNMPKIIPKKGTPGGPYHSPLAGISSFAFFKPSSS